MDREAEKKEINITGELLRSIWSNLVNHVRIIANSIGLDASGDTIW